jgi:hypothetical protein
MELSRVLYVPYQLIRRPLAVVDRHAVSKLSAGNPVRDAYRGALNVADTVMGLVLDEPDLVAADALKRFRPNLDEPLDQEPAVEHVPSPADEQRRQAFAQKEDQVTRSNQGLAAMQRDLARMRAVVDAREHTETD